MLLLVEGEEKAKFGVLIFILAHEIKQLYSLSWKHCTYEETANLLEVIMSQFGYRRVTAFSLLVVIQPQLSLHGKVKKSA